MKSVSPILSAIFLSCVIHVAAQADPVTITFDQPPCTPAFPGDYPSSCYANYGLTLFSGSGGSTYTGFAIRTAADAVSAPNVASGVIYPELRGLFSVPNSIEMAWTTYVSLYVAGSTGA